MNDLKAIFDFRCPDGHKFEKYVDSDVHTVSCVICSQPSDRLVGGARPMLDPISGDFPSATRKWAINRQQKIKAEKREAKSNS